MGATDVLESSGTESMVVDVWTGGGGSGTENVVVDVWTGRGGSGTVWLVGGEQSSSTGSLMAAAGWDGGESSSSAEGVWLNDGGEDFLCSL